MLHLVEELAEFLVLGLQPLDLGLRLVVAAGVAGRVGAGVGAARLGGEPVRIEPLEPHADYRRPLVDRRLRRGRSAGAARGGASSAGGGAAGGSQPVERFRRRRRGDTTSGRDDRPSRPARPAAGWTRAVGDAVRSRRSRGRGAGIGRGSSGSPSADPRGLWASAGVGGAVRADARPIPGPPPGTGRGPGWPEKPRLHTRHVKHNSPSRTFRLRPPGGSARTGVTAPATFPANNLTRRPVRPVRVARNRPDGRSGRAGCPGRARDVTLDRVGHWADCDGSRQGRRGKMKLDTRHPRSPGAGRRPGPSPSGAPGQ